MSGLEIFEHYFQCLQPEQEVLLSVAESSTWSFLSSILFPLHGHTSTTDEHHPNDNNDEVKVEEEEVIKPCCDFVLGRFDFQISAMPSSSSSSSSKVDIAIVFPPKYPSYKVLPVSLSELFLAPQLQ